MHRLPFVLLAATGLLGAGCATDNLSSASVSLPGSLERGCLAASLRSEPDVLNFREIPEEGAATWWFEISDPSLVAEELPAFTVRQVASASGTLLEVEASFRAKRQQAADHRQAILARDQRILERAVERCAGRGLEFEPARPCGKGETDTLCATGRLAEPPAPR